MPILAYTKRAGLSVLFSFLCRLTHTASHPASALRCCATFLHISSQVTWVWCIVFSALSGYFHFHLSWIRLGQWDSLYRALSGFFSSNMLRLCRRVQRCFTLYQKWEFGREASNSDCRWSCCIDTLPSTGGN